MNIVVKICIWLQWIKLVFFCSNRFFPMGIPNKRNILLIIYSCLYYMYNTNPLIIICLLIGCYLMAEIKLHSIPPPCYTIE